MFVGWSACVLCNCSPCSSFHTYLLVLACLSLLSIFHIGWLVFVCFTSPSSIFPAKLFWVWCAPLPAVFALLVGWSKCMCMCNCPQCSVFHACWLVWGLPRACTVQYFSHLLASPYGSHSISLASLLWGCLAPARSIFFAKLVWGCPALLLNSFLAWLPRVCFAPSQYFYCLASPSVFHPLTVFSCLAVPSVSPPLSVHCILYFPSLALSLCVSPLLSIIIAWLVRVCPPPPLSTLYTVLS